MEVKIGVQHAPREIALESTQSVEEIERAVTEALGGKAEVLILMDERGRKIMVPSERIAYVELGAPTARKVGFGTI